MAKTTPEQTALERIEQAFKKKAELDLSVLELTSLPPEIGRLTHLKRLTLGTIIFGNQLSALPPEIGQLQNLQRLSLSSNQLNIPPEVLGTFDPEAIFKAYFEGTRPVNEAKLILVGRRIFCNFGDRILQAISNLSQIKG